MSDYKDFFSKNADAYANSSSHRSGTDLATAIEHLKLHDDFVAIDLASGTGFTAMALAEHVMKVVAYDGTSEMLEKAKKLAAEKNLSNIEYVVGDVSDIPFPDNTFDIATCRRAAHHFTDKAKFFSETYRILKPGGKLGLVDMSRPPLDEADLFNTIERIRDTSHVAAEKESDWIKLAENAGFKISEKLSSEELFPFEKWLSPVGMDTEAAEEILSLLKSTDSVTLRSANVDPDSLAILKPRVTLIATKE